MKLSKMVFGVAFGLLSMSPALANTFERVKLEVAFVDGTMKQGKLDLLINSADNGNVYVRDVTAADGDRYPISLRTGITGASYMFQNTQQNAEFICNQLGLPKATVASITAKAPKNSFKYSDSLLVKTPSTNLSANGSGSFPSISIVKCCKTAECVE